MSSPTLAEAELRRKMVAIARRMYAKGLVVATDGNLSTRLPGGTILITPTNCCKATVEEHELVTVDLEGRMVSGSSEPSSEIAMHLGVYRKRPDVCSVIHAHPPIATAFTVAGIELAQCILPEVVLTFAGGVPTSPYATPTTVAMASSIEQLVEKSDAVLLDRHGSLTLGRDLDDAFYKLERVEYTAQVSWIARQLGKVKVLAKDEVERLLEIRAKMGIGGRVEPCNLCGACCS